MAFNDSFDQASLDARWAGSTATFDDANDRVDVTAGTLTSVSGTLTPTNWGALDFSFSFIANSDYADWSILLPRNDTQPRAQVRLRSGGVLGGNRVSTTTVLDFVDAQYGSFSGVIGVDGQVDTWLNGENTIRVTRDNSGNWEIFLNGTSKGTGTEPAGVTTYYSTDANIDGVVEFGQGPYYVTSAVLVEANVDPQLDTPEPDHSIETGATGSINFGDGFSDANSDTLTFSISPDISALTGWSWNSATGVATYDGSQGLLTQISYTVTATDGQGGTDATDTVLIEVVAPAFSVDSVSGGDQPGESWVFALSNASGSGMTANIGGTALTVTAQTSGSITVTIPDLLTFDGGIHRFSENLTVQIVDGANSDTIATPITPATGFAQVQMPNPITGVWAGSTFEAAISPGVLEVGDYIHCTAPTDSDPENGIFPEDSTIVYRIMEMSDPTPVWGAAGTITIPAAADITPDQFDLGADVTGAEPSAVTTRTFTIAGIDSGETISFTATGDASVSPSTGQLGDTITVTLTAGPFGTTVTGGVTSGGVSDSFSVTSRAAVTPTIDTQPTNQTVNEGATATFTAAFTNAASIQWYDASDDSALSGETSASLSITTALADNGNTYYAIATSADSQTVTTNTVTLTVNEVVVVTPPTMPAATTATVAEGSTAVGTYTASSGDSPITYTLGGTDAASFTINSSTGVVAFASAPDYETKASYSFTVIATNSAGSDSQAVTVTVTNIAEQAPTINTGGTTAVTITEGESYSDLAWTWSDDVVSGQSVTWSGDTVNSSTTAGEYTRTATATNAFGTTTQDYTITVVAAASTAITVDTPFSRTIFVSPNGETGVPVFIKDTSDVIDFLVDFSAALQGDSISVVAVTTSNITLDATYRTGNKVQLWLSGGIAKVMAELKITAQSNAGRTIERSFKVKVGEY